MTSATATLSNYRQSPRKVRIAADLMRGKKIEEARAILTFANKRAGNPLIKLLDSAVSNAKNMNLDLNDLIIKEVRVDEGRAMKRRRPMSRGRAFPIIKRSSHVFIKLESKNGDVKIEAETKEVKAEAKTEKKPAKKAVAKKEVKAKKEVVK